MPSTAGIPSRPTLTVLSFASRRRTNSLTRKWNWDTILRRWIHFRAWCCPGTMPGSLRELLSSTIENGQIFRMFPCHWCSLWSNLRGWVILLTRPPWQEGGTGICTTGILKPSWECRWSRRQRRCFLPTKKNFPTFNCENLMCFREFYLWCKIGAKMVWFWCFFGAILMQSYAILSARERPARKMRG